MSATKMGKLTLMKSVMAIPAMLQATSVEGLIGDAQYQTCLNQTLMKVLCSGLSLSLSDSGSLKGADISAPPGMESMPKRAGISARRNLLGTKLRSLSISSTMCPVSFNA